MASEPDTSVRSPRQRLTPTAALLMLRIVTASLVAGPLVLTVVAFNLHAADPNQVRPNADLFGIVAPAACGLVVPLALFVPHLAGKARLRILAEQEAPESLDAATPSQIHELLSGIFTGHIVACALWEGLAMMGGALFLISAQPLCLIPVTVGFAGLVWKFPSETGLRSRLEQGIFAWQEARRSRSV